MLCASACATRASALCLSGHALCQLRLTDPDLPRMGERLRLKSDFDISGFSPPVEAILKCLKKYGMFVADNGLEWTLSVAPDERIPVMHEELRRIHRHTAFEVVRITAVSRITTHSGCGPNATGCRRRAAGAVRHKKHQATGDDYDRGQLILPLVRACVSWRRDRHPRNTAFQTPAASQAAVLPATPSTGKPSHAKATRRRVVDPCQLARCPSTSNCGPIERLHAKAPVIKTADRCSTRSEADEIISTLRIFPPGNVLEHRHLRLAGRGRLGQDHRLDPAKARPLPQRPGYGLS